MHRRFVSKLLIYTLLTLYLVLDIMVFQGPLYHNLKDWGVGGVASLEGDRERGIVARIFRRPVHRSQVDWRVDEMLWSSGQTRQDVSEKTLKSYSKIALDDLVDFELLREKVKLSGKEHPVDPEKVQAALQRFVSRFSNEQEMLAVMKAQGISSMQEMQLRVEGLLQQELYLERQLASALVVTDQDIEAWLVSHKDHFYQAERRQLRHVFLAALENKESVAIQRLEAGLAELRSGAKTFAQLAQWSEDARTQNDGGMLGWTGKERLEADFAKAVFELPLKQPQIVKSSLGWHLVEVMGSEPRRERTAEESSEEITAAIQAERRPKVIQVYRQKLRYRHQRYVQIDWVGLGWKEE